MEGVESKATIRARERGYYNLDKMWHARFCYKAVSYTHLVLIRNLGMIDTIWAIILPGAILPYNIQTAPSHQSCLPLQVRTAAP